jgi:RimJ/RimL family protein N-acetyltransferase
MSIFNGLVGDRRAPTDHGLDKSGQGPPVANINGRYCDLRQLAPTDYDWLYQLWMHPENLMTFRFGGIPPSPERFSSIVWAGVSCQFVITQEGKPADRIGLVTFYNQVERSQVAYVALVLEPHFAGMPWAWEGVALAIDHFFRATRMRKLCFEVAEWNMARLQGLEAFHVQREGCQREQEFMDGRWWDRHLFALFRDDWARCRDLVLKQRAVAP